LTERELFEILLHYFLPELGMERVTS
jgi:hypothetical protein